MRDQAKAEQKMARQERQKRVRVILENKKFKLIDSLAKADTFRYGADHILYSYNGQGEADEPNIAIDPRIEYSDLLKLDGVRLNDSKHPEGLRKGGAMKEFPKQDASKTPVGRMFTVPETVLPGFLDALSILFSSVLKDRDKKGIADGGVDTRESTHSSLPLDDSSADTQSENRMEQYRAQVADALDQIGAEYANKPGEEVDAIVKRRIGQGPFRDLLEEVHGVTCCVSGITNRRLLIASHIVPWSKASSIQKTDHENGLLLSVIWDALFDKGFISFDDHGKLLRSEELDNATAERLGISMEAKLPEEMLTKRRKENLSWHRREYGFFP